jgi:hypothetical protein
MIDAIFLSAGVPDPNRGPQYAKTADTVAIAAAVNALVHVTLGRRILVWGGQPAITPMIWAVAEGLGIDYGRWVKLYQSEFFRDEYPEDNQKFQNVTYIKSVNQDLSSSLRHMREKMFADFNFTAAVFVGGMGGIVAEFEMLRELQPRALLLPVTSTGGAVLDVAERMSDLPQDLSDDLDYISLFHRHLGISVKENRYRTPDEQPANVSDRLWRLQKPGDQKA